ncbi:hypothetical protein bsdcttw_37610 [Anaerocolumna chitinilytica]|uniref:Uncharacterized protein n=1 Tax=Anaerocolumna chitinilytica TaxID=1727145 RepID=A0A7I8DQL9_9FIRM|nr:hypothetical protein bsdcttw_37610 [Anaerocolumna chitinilytica]
MQKEQLLFQIRNSIIKLVLRLVQPISSGKKDSELKLIKFSIMRKDALCVQTYFYMSVFVLAGICSNP